jgi:tRNA modification GTPase
MIVVSVGSRNADWRMCEGLREEWVDGLMGRRFAGEWDAVNSAVSRMDDADTIVAVSTAVGLGAIGIVRLSGPGAIAIVQRAFCTARELPLQEHETHCLLYGHIVDPDSGDAVDEVLVAVMRKPRTYTREDVVEVHCHGGVAAQRAVLRLMARLGARPAEPGEFTKRAFVNGRIDLAQAESVAAIVGARSTGALRASVRQLEGGLSDRLRALRRDLVSLLARIEASVDFSDEDVDEVDWPSVAEGLAAVRSGLAALCATAFVGRALEHGVRTAIVGKPNVGKSSLLNGLLMRERAIVSDTPGTTRDTVEELLEIGGLPIHLVDTAGLRSDGDCLEQLGVARSLRAMEEADLVLMVVDVSQPEDEDEARVVSGLEGARTIIVGNKRDLVEDEALCRRLTRVGACGGRAESEDGEVRRLVCAVSAATGEGLDELRTLIQLLVTGAEGLRLEEPVLASERQRVLVGQALEFTDAALSGVRGRAAEELVSEDMRDAIRALGRVTGEDLTPDLLEEIFSRFCLGK